VLFCGDLHKIEFLKVVSFHSVYVPGKLDGDDCGGWRGEIGNLIYHLAVLQIQLQVDRLTPEIC
jgi:hypothetical protein